MQLIKQNYRQNYILFGKLCKVPDYVLTNLNEYFDLLWNTKIPNFNQNGYRVWWVQSNDNLNDENDFNWINWTDDNFLSPTKSFFCDFFKDVCRLRFSFLKPNKAISYHASHMVPRIHIPLNDSSAIYYTKDLQNQEYEYKLEYGYAHFLNVCLPHAINAGTELPRKNCYFSLTSFNDEKFEENFKK